MNINRKSFFDAIRTSIHKGSMTPEQVAAYEAILDAAAAYPVTDPRHLAYIFATARGEVGSAMQPVREIGRGKGKPYGKADAVTGEAYFGRGFVQLTWANNYKVMGKRIGFPLYEEPDLALRPEIAARIIVVGMMEGQFTGKKLGDYLHSGKTDYANARRIINLMDRAEEFAGYARTYEAAIRSALKEEGKGEVKDKPQANPQPAPAPDPSPAPAPPTVPPPKPRVSAVQWIIGAVAAALTFIFAWIFAGGQ